MPQEQWLSGGQARLVRTCFESPEAWAETLAAVSTSGPGGLGPAIDVIDDPALEDRTWRDLLDGLVPGPTGWVMFVADCETMRSPGHA